MKPGRNDPCPCGSGRKHKHCCLRAAGAALDSPDALIWRRIRRALDEPKSGTTPFGFAMRTYGRVVTDEAWSDFCDANESFDPSSPHLSLFMSWFTHRWAPEPDSPVDASLAGRHPTELYLERMRMEPPQQRYLEACLKAHFSFHEALRCDPGRGIQVRDLFTGRECYVMERGVAETMQVGDILFGMVVEVDGIHMLDCAGSFFIPPIRKIALLDWRKQVLHGRMQCTPEELRDLDLEVELIDWYRETTDDMLHPRLPEMRNTDGDLIEIHRLSFDIDSPEQAIRALADLDPSQTADELLASAERTTRGGIKQVSWTWKKAGNAVHESWSSTALGSLEIKSRKLIAEVNSARRAEELRALVAARLGDQARFRTDAIQSLASLARHGPGSAAEVPQPMDVSQHPEIQAAIQEMMAKHYERWVAESIPALDGRTPLECMGDPEGREKVLALVIDVERHSRQMTPPVDEAIFQRLRERLGLPPAE